MCKSGHLLTHSISNILPCFKPSTKYWFLNLGDEIKIVGRISPLENGYFDGLQQSRFSIQNYKTERKRKKEREKIVKEKRGKRISCISISNPTDLLWLERNVPSVLFACKQFRQEA
ncbi:hypothetical protein TNCV_5060801 [Trichonephila clavipes]|nr:hypothetical protein TNCV_5060801 [Trichonephila clavipes]